MNAMQHHYLHYLNAMGIQVWQSNERKCPPPVTCPNAALTTTEWDDLRAAVANCTACGLHQTRTQTVFGTGNPAAELMIIGEAPGFHEDKQGKPFVGRAGQLLTAMLQAIGFERETVYIANILKCRPPNNRDPLAAEVDLCTPFLSKQIALIQPRLLLAVGRIAAHYLLNSKAPLAQLRNKIYTYGNENTPLIVTYHPAYLLRNPKDKGHAFADLQLAYRTLRRDTDGLDGLDGLDDVGFR